MYKSTYYRCTPNDLWISDSEADNEMLFFADLEVGSLVSVSCVVKAT